MNQIVKTEDAALMEQVLLNGDLSKLHPEQRVNYYRNVCESIGLNPLTKPFDYINLNGKLTLYAKKDAADQLRKINGVSIDDIDVQETADRFIVKVKGHDKTGRADVEVGVVNKTDMRGDVANAQMKAITKAKRRLTLSICGLGWLDETEIETIPTAKPVTIQETGEIVDALPVVPAPTTNGTRPYSPEVLKDKLAARAKAHEGKPVKGNEAQVIAMNLDEIFLGDKSTRHAVLHYLTGHQSANDLPDAMKLAVKEWIKPTQNPTSGEWKMDAIAEKEAHAVYKAAMIAQGQTELFETSAA